MKTDYSFKLVTLIVFAGVLIAFFSPNHQASHGEGNTVEIAHATPQAE